MAQARDRVSMVRALEAAGCVAADEEADDLLRRAGGDAELRRMLTRRLTGEPLAWITGRAAFCGIEVAVAPGVYVPRWQSETLARMAAERLPDDGVGVDLATGSGAVALVMRSVRPGARVVATEIDDAAARCARHNGVVVYQGHLDQPLPAALEGGVDVMVGVLPYVPTDALRLLPRDVQAFEPRRALDGGAGGVELVSVAVPASRRWVKIGGWLLLEVGSDQVAAVTSMFRAAGYRALDVVEDGDGDPRGVCGRRER